MDDMKTFHFNTGVRPFDHNPPAGKAFMSECKDSGNGVYVIPFDCEDVPDNAEFVFACDSPDVKKDDPSFITREIHNSRLISKYAYFKI